MTTLAGFHRRFCDRVRCGLPVDDEEIGCEDAIGFLRHHLPRLMARMDRKAGKCQPVFLRGASFSIPGSPPSSRLRSSEGYIPFHFAKNEVEGRTAQAFDDYARGKKIDAETIERAVEGGKDNATSIDGAAKVAYMLDHGGREGGPVDSWTNLRDPSHWNVIEGFERDRRPNPNGNPPGISIFYDRAPHLFNDMAHQPQCPEGLRKLISKEQVRVAAARPLSERKARDGVRWIDERAFDVYVWIKAQPRWPSHIDKHTRPVRLSEGRAVQTHVAGEGEYHAALGPAARARIRAGMIDLVQSQRNPGSEANSGWFLPMTICDHVPGGLNDPLNDHFHWLIGTRRARYTDAGELQFERNKVGAITRDGWIDVMREELARLTNIELSAIGADVRYHPGTLAEMGINAPAQQKMHGHRTALERAGVSTERGLANDTEAWRRMFAGAARDHLIALASIDAELASVARHDAVRKARIEAADLRFEAAQVQILIDMSRSRATRTLRFAPEYSAKSSSPSATAGWLARGGKAERHLHMLDDELKLERDGVADRLAQAEHRDSAAAALLAAGIVPTSAIALTSIAVEQGNNTALAKSNVAVERSAQTHRAVDVIARAPLLVDEVDGTLLIAPRDDVERLVLGVDLSRAQKRLAGVRSAQQRELAQVQAFARRHGANALFDNACNTHTLWFRSAVQKWRDTPVMQRYLAEREAHLNLGREIDIRGHRDRRGQRPDRFGSIVGLDELRSLADLPFLADLTGGAEAAHDRPISREETDGSRPDMPFPASAPPASGLPAGPPSPALVWSDVEQRHRSFTIWREQRDRQRIDQAVANALVDRVGQGRAITPYAARLIEKLANGFDPESVSHVSGPTGLSLDQRDAPEIEVLSRDPGFRTHLDAARRRDEVLARLVTAVRPASTGPNFLGRVTIDRDRVRFGPATPGQTGPWRTPLEWADSAVKLIAERQLPLSRQNGLVGIYDDDVLRLSRYNYLGLLHPAVQHAFDIQLRIQAEVERDIIADLRTGALKVNAVIERDRLSDTVTTRVQLIGGIPQAQTFVARRRSDAGFYFRCREAAAGLPAGAPPLRHESPVVRAWLTARDEGAAAPVLDLLGRKVTKLNDGLIATGMSDADTKALMQLLAPTPAMSPRWPKRGQGLRNRPPLNPGRWDPSR